MYDEKMLSYQPKLNLVGAIRKGRRNIVNRWYLRLGYVGDISPEE